MILLKESKSVAKEAYTIPPDINRDVQYNELRNLIDVKAINSGTPSFKYDSAKRSLCMVTANLKGHFIFGAPGIDISTTANLAMLISPNGMKRINYYEKHSINGGKPLTFVRITIYLQDGGTATISYQIVGYWHEAQGN